MPSHSARTELAADPGLRTHATGWERTDIGVPPESTVVEIDLRPTATGTELRLVHRGLDGPMADSQAGGKVNYLTRLATRAERGDAGHGRRAEGCVPTRAEAGIA
jgi:hypothetical protein